MIYRSKAPLRIGLAGGGTDVSPYSDQFGGAILNATVSLFAYANIEPIDENAIIVEALDRKEEQRFELATSLPIDGTLDLLKGVYNRIQKDFGMPYQDFVCQLLWMRRPVLVLVLLQHWLLPLLEHLLKC